MRAMSLRSLALILLVGTVSTAVVRDVAAQTVTGTLAQDTAKGTALLSEARKALGGEDKLAAIKRLQLKGESQRVQGGQTLDGEIEMLIELPDKFRLDEEISLPGGAITITRTQALNGEEAWDVTEGGLPGGLGGRGGRGGDFGGRGGRLGGVLGALGGDANAAQGAQADPARQAQIRELQRRTRQTDLARYLVAFLATPGESAAWVGTAVTPKDEKADVIEFKTADGTATRLFLDISTHMPLMMTFAGPAARQANAGARGRRGGGDPAAGGAPQGDQPQGGQAQGPQGGQPAEGGQARRGGAAPGQPVTIEMYLSDFKVENGVKMPHVITREVNGEIQEQLTFKSFKFNPNFKANTFTQPKQ
jgi:hypothetical protein